MTLELVENLAKRIGGMIGQDPRKHRFPYPWPPSTPEDSTVTCP